MVIEVTRTVEVAPEHVFAVLADGWSYAGWVVGNSHVREVDPHWPAVGAKIHHSAGLWPLQVKDWTEVTAMTPDRMIDLRARVWPLAPWVWPLPVPFGCPSLTLRVCVSDA